MARILLKQPNGKWAQFSTVSDSMIVWDQTKEEMVEFARNEAAEEAEVRIQKWMTECEAHSELGRITAWQEAVASHRDQYPEDKL